MKDRKDQTKADQGRPRPTKAEKINEKRLRLKTETLRALAEDDLNQAAGGATPPTYTLHSCSCHCSSV